MLQFSTQNSSQGLIGNIRTLHQNSCPVISRLSPSPGLRPTTRTQPFQPDLLTVYYKTFRRTFHHRYASLCQTIRTPAFRTREMRMTLIRRAPVGQLKMPGPLAQIGFVDEPRFPKGLQRPVYGCLVQPQSGQSFGNVVLCQRCVCPHQQLQNGDTPLRTRQPRSPQHLYTPCFVTGFHGLSDGRNTRLAPIARRRTEKGMEK